MGPLCRPPPDPKRGSGSSPAVLAGSGEHPRNRPRACQTWEVLQKPGASGAAVRAGRGRRANRTSGFTGVILLHPWKGSTLAFWEQAASAQARLATLGRGPAIRVLRAFRGDAGLRRSSSLRALVGGAQPGHSRQTVRASRRNTGSGLSGPAWAVKLCKPIELPGDARLLNPGHNTRSKPLGQSF